MLTLTVDLDPPQAKIDRLRYGLSAFNVAQEPRLLELPREDLVTAVYAADGTLIGGAVGEADLGWLYVDSLWVADAHREHKWGTRLLRTLEETARQRGLPQVYLMTADFQALPFYQKLGYHIVAELADRPLGHTCYYLVRTLPPQPLDPQVQISVMPDSALIHAISSAQVAASPIPIEFGEVAVWLEDGDELYGGAVVHTFWEWGTLRWFWIAEQQRGIGYGRQMLAQVERVLRQQNMRGLLLDTLDFQASAWVQRQGFQTLFTLSDRPPQHVSHFMVKRF